MSVIRRVSGILVLMAILLFWQMLGLIGLICDDTIPVPTSIFQAIIAEVQNGDLVAQSLITLRHLVLGFEISIAVGIPVGFVLGRSRLAYLAMEPIVEFLRPLPVIAVLPIAVLILGLGDGMVYCVIAFGCGWVVLIHTMDAARDIDPILIETGRTLQVRPLRRFLTIMVPAAGPGIFTGLRIGISLAAIITIVVELISGFSGGLGDYIGQLEGALRIPEAYGGLVVATLIGYLLAHAVELTERIFLTWHRPSNVR